ncbi:MAG: TonB-dependent receptor plug domain-containing protein, partial [Muribaculaceae bacterium]|nr:TonB-dependent receptor plug domain-containing protein [Muribaculaceae bacterium]
MLSFGVAGYAAADNKVTIDVSNVTLESVLRAIEKQTDYRFFYSKEAVDVKTRVNVKAQNEPVTSLLDRILPKQGISYVIDDQRIALKQSSSQQSAPPTQKDKKTGFKGNKIKVDGTVTDTKGEPLIGASVKVGGEDTGVATDIDGRYEISMPEGGILEFSYIGFQTEKKKVAKAGKLDIALAEDTKQLDEVVVIGYGTIDKKELTSAVSHVSAKDFQSVAATDVSMLIQGKVPGLSVVNTAAADPNSAASLQIRGVSSREAGVSPLIVLDGVPGASLTNINPNDIASFDVLKDGAASAIYGTRGSNGVIVVTTKKGARDGRTHTTYSATLSWDKANRDLDMMNAEDYRSLRIPSGDAAVDLGASEDLFNL